MTLSEMGYYAPFFAVEVPVNDKGEGPVSQDESARSVWQVWCDDTHATVCECWAEEPARLIADALNAKAKAEGQK